MGEPSNPLAYAVCQRFEEMIPAFVIIFTLFPPENIALNKSSYQQYPYPENPALPSFLTEAHNAVDGLKSNLSIFGGQCVISGNNQQNATWWVNLTSILSIHHITIYYRTENRQWGM